MLAHCRFGRLAFVDTLLLRKRASPEDRRAFRQERTAPLMAGFHRCVTEQRRRISAKSRLGEKLGFTHRHWDGLQVFLTDGRIEMDTNPVENTIRPLTLNRRNTLFPTTSARRLASLLRRSIGFLDCKLVRKRHVGEHVMLAGAYQASQL
jgi:hypothetical protein